MKVQIRNSVFETNSSSTHSIVIGNGVYVMPKEDGTIKLVNYSHDWADDENNKPTSIYFGSDEFGWEFRRLETIEDRASYLWTAIIKCYCKTIEEADNAKNYIQSAFAEVGIETNFKEYELMTKTYNYNKERTYTYIAFKDDDEYSAYIDHGDETSAFVTCMLNCKELLYSYILSDYSYVATGNDNDEPKDEDHYTRYKGYGQPKATFYKGN